MPIRSFGISDKGRLRINNEDNYLVNEKDGIFMVADGLGGLAKGELASQIAVETVEDFITRSRIEDITWPIEPIDSYSAEENRLLAAISLANYKIFQRIQQEPAIDSMGATLTGTILDGESLIVANVGDSRTYRIRDGQIDQLTEDHSWVMEEVKKGNLTAEEARIHPHKNIITRALGVSESVSVDIRLTVPRESDLFLSCSDGLTDMLTDDEILSIAASGNGKPLDTLGTRLVQAANDNGGRDNITVVLLFFAPA